LIDQLLIKQPRIRSLATRLAYGSGVRVIELMRLTLVVDALKENGYLRASQKAAYLSVFRDGFRFGLTSPRSSRMTPSSSI
jgi:hypothetical protein